MQLKALPCLKINKPHRPPAMAAVNMDVGVTPVMNHVELFTKKCVEANQARCNVPNIYRPIKSKLGTSERCDISTVNDI